MDDQRPPNPFDAPRETQQAIASTLLDGGKATTLPSGIVAVTRLDEERTVTLPSGRVATIRPGKGRDVKRAFQMAGADGGHTGVLFGLIAVKTRIDGRAITLEDVEEMLDADVFLLLGEVMGKGPSSPGTTSSRS